MKNAAARPSYAVRVKFGGVIRYCFTEKFALCIAQHRADWYGWPVYVEAL